MTQISEQELLRRKKKEELEAVGINPYPPELFTSSTNTQLILQDYPNSPEAFKDVKLAGRIMSRRIMGAASFIELQDAKGKIQLYLHRDSLCTGEDITLYNTVFKKLLDIGDVIGIAGYAFTTQVGEITIHVTELTLLAKALRPLPIVKEDEKQVYDAFTDPEQRYRQRYVDLLITPATRKIFQQRTQMTQVMRNYLNGHWYEEVETPILQPLYGGASARPFTTHHNTLDMKLYLRIAPELYLKRLIVGGYEGVYEIAKDFLVAGVINKST